MSQSRLTKPSAELAPVVALRRDFTTLALRCPSCNTEFAAEIPVYGEPVGRDTDLRPRFDGPDPLPSLIHSCPSCRYTAYSPGFDNRSEEAEEDFEPLTRALGDRSPPRFQVPGEEELEELRGWIRRSDFGEEVAEGREPFGAGRYLLGARCYEYLHEEDDLGGADYLLRAAWCARASGDLECERSCCRLAAAGLKRALDGLQVDDCDRARTLYLLGEVSRRAGDFAAAVDAFTQVEVAADAEEEEGAFFDRLARRQLALAVMKCDAMGPLPPGGADPDHD